MCSRPLSSGCYIEADGNDYRGTVSINKKNATCAVWSDPKLSEAYMRAYARRGVFVPENYPDAGLGGHNYCRNPDHGVGLCKGDADGADCKKPWCLYWKDPDGVGDGDGNLAGDSQLGWGFCDGDLGLGRLSNPACTAAAALQPACTALQLG